MRAVVLIAAAAIALSSCHEKAPVVAVTPRALVDDLYKQRAAGPSPFGQTNHRDLVDKYFDRRLAELIWKDAHTPSGEEGAIDFDPLYDAQDLEITELAIRPAEITGDNARVVVTFVNSGKPQTITYSLKLASSGWKITDIHYTSGYTLLGLLEANYKPAKKP